MNLKEFKQMLGKVKTWQTRLGTYIALLSYIQITYIFVEKKPFGVDPIIWITILGIIVILVVVFDVFLVIDDATDYLFKRSKAFRDLCDDVKEIKEGMKK